MIVVGTSGYAWTTLRNLNQGLRGSDVISNEVSAPDGATDILLIGNDSRTDAQGNPLPEEVLQKLRASASDGASNDLTDTMILVRIPNGGQRASAISFPRDTRVDMGRFGEHKLNSALARAQAEAKAELQEKGVSGKELTKQARAEGQKFLIKTIEDLAGVSIDHYAEVNLLGFYQLTKAVGGVKVCLKEPVDDSEYSGAVFPAGPQTISGADALAFVRQRHGLPRGDLDRIVRQQVFMSGLANKILSAGTLSNPAKLSKLMDALKDSIVLDKGWDVVSFAQKMQGIAAGNIKFHTIPVEMSQSGLNADPDEVKQFADNLLLPPEKRRAEQRAQEAREERRSSTTVNVYNAAGIGGLAGRVQDSLVDAGFEQGVAANADSMRQSSVVRYAPGEKKTAEGVAAELGGLPLQPSDGVEPGTVEVYVGDDYDGPGRQGFAGAKKVQLDGVQQAAPEASPRQNSGSQPITAGGVPCVY